MRPRFVDALNKILGTEIGKYLVPSPALMYVLAMLVVTYMIFRRSQRSGLSQYHALGFCLWAIIGGMIGAKVFFLLLHLKTIIAHPDQIFDVSGGTGSWGAYIGGAIGFTTYLKLQQQPVLQYTDVLASCLGLGPFIGRWSCFLNGCCYGKLSNLPWAVAYPRGSIPYLMQQHAGLIEEDLYLSLPIHPVQLYHSLTGLVLFGLMTFYWKKWKHKPGVTFFSYWIIYCCTRFIWDFFRGDASRSFIDIFSTSQLMALFIIMASGVGLLKCLKIETK